MSFTVVIGLPIREGKNVDGLNLTADSLRVFMKYATEAGEWNGVPLLEGDNAERGNVSDLKKKGLIVTTVDSDKGAKGGALTWISFTDLGREFAEFHGVCTDSWD